MRPARGECACVSCNCCLGCMQNRFRDSMLEAGLCARRGGPVSARERERRERVSFYCVVFCGASPPLVCASKKWTMYSVATMPVLGSLGHVWPPPWLVTSSTLCSGLP